MRNVLKADYVRKFETFPLTSGYGPINTYFINPKTGVASPAHCWNKPTHKGEAWGKPFHVCGSGYLYAKYPGWVMATEKDGQKGWVIVENSNPVVEGRLEWTAFNPFHDQKICLSISCIEDDVETITKRIAPFNRNTVKAILAEEGLILAKPDEYRIQFGEEKKLFFGGKFVGENWMDSTGEFQWRDRHNVEVQIQFVDESHVCSTNSMVDMYINDEGDLILTPRWVRERELFPDLVSMGKYPISGEVREVFAMPFKGIRALLEKISEVREDLFPRSFKEELYVHRHWSLFSRDYKLERKSSGEVIETGYNSEYAAVKDYFKVKECELIEIETSNGDCKLVKWNGRIFMMSHDEYGDKTLAKYSILPLRNRGYSQEVPISITYETTEKVWRMCAKKYGVLKVRATFEIPDRELQPIEMIWIDKLLLSIPGHKNFYNVLETIAGILEINKSDGSCITTHHPQYTAEVGTSAKESILVINKKNRYHFGLNHYGMCHLGDRDIVEVLANKILNGDYQLLFEMISKQYNETDPWNSRSDEYHRHAMGIVLWAHQSGIISREDLLKKAASSRKKASLSDIVIEYMPKEIAHCGGSHDGTRWIEKKCYFTKDTLWSFVGSNYNRIVEFPNPATTEAGNFERTLCGRGSDRYFLQDYDGSVFQFNKKDNSLVRMNSKGLPGCELRVFKTLLGSKETYFLYEFGNFLGNHIEGDTLKGTLEMFKKRQKVRGLTISLNDVRNDRAGTAGYCLTGVKGFLASRMPHVHRLVCDYSSWEKVPGEIMSIEWTLASAEIFKGFSNPTTMR